MKEQSIMINRHEDMQQMQKANLLSVSDLSAQLNMEPKTVYAKVEAGKIPFLKIGSLLRFKQDEINAWLEICRNSKPCLPEKVSTKRRTSRKSNSHVSAIITKAKK